MVKENVKEIYNASPDCYYLTPSNELYKLTDTQELIEQNVKKALVYDDPVNTNSWRITTCYITNDNNLYVIGQDKSYNNVSDVFSDCTYLGLDKKLYKIADGTEIANNVEEHISGSMNHSGYTIYYINTSRQLVKLTNNRVKYNY